MNDYNLEYIDKLRIHELRDFAKKLGVSSPTTMKKDELIDKINSIISGQDESFDSTRRHLKKQNDIDFFSLLTSENSNVLESLLAEPAIQSSPEDANTTIIMKKKQAIDIDAPYQSSKDFYGFSFKIAQNECQYGETNVCNIFGYLDIHQSGYGVVRQDGFLPSNKDSYVASSYIRKYNLKKGYFICGKAKNIMENHPKVVFEITQIEDSTKPKKTFDFDEIPHKGIGNELYLDKFDIKIKRGERQYIESMSLKDAVDLGFDIVDENGVGVKLINIKARPEEQFSSHQQMQVINIPFNKTEHELVETVGLVLERIRREFELGKSNVLMIYNFCELIRSFNVACEGCYDFSKFNAQALNKILNILYMTKNLESQLSCSVLCIDKNGTAKDIKSIMELELLPLFNAIHDKIKRK